ncbi:FAD-dependent oxidoreductase [Desertibaculum subflavum]|uniref:FAD-dependent oxidoreductase n=1 Tax=Desertibaculum subflavum TaxID=2268458 RepID=UPI000E66AF90
MTDSQLPVAVIGAGPVGLAAAAHLIERGQTPIVVEAGDKVASSVRAWSHVRMFSPWQYNVDSAARRLLDKAGWQPPAPDAIPTGGDLVARYLEPLAELPAMRPHLRLGARVAAVSRKGHDKVRSEGRDRQPFVLRVEGAAGEDVIEARAVIDASGTWTMPNPSGADGLPAIGERGAADHIRYGIPDVLGGERARYEGRAVLVIGGGHSALNAIIELAALKQAAPKTRIVWALRKERVEAAYGGEAADQLPARGALGSQVRALVESGTIEVVTPFRVARIADGCSCGLRVSGEVNGSSRTIAVDEIIVATGFRPDLSFLREIRLTLDPWLESSGSLGPLIDPNLHSCGTVRPHGAKELAHAEPDFFIAGMKSYGRAPTFLLATGHEQVRSIAASLSGDAEAAGRVELALPETGVCVSRPIGVERAGEPVAAGCCGPAREEAAVQQTSACCAPAKPAAAAEASARQAGGCCPA